MSSRPDTFSKKKKTPDMTMMGPRTALRTCREEVGAGDGGDAEGR